MQVRILQLLLCLIFLTVLLLLSGGNPIPPPAVAVVNAQAHNVDLGAPAMGMVNIGVPADVVAAVVAVDEAAGGVVMLNELELAAAAVAAPGIVDEHV